jgi:hypothetical protein
VLFEAVQDIKLYAGVQYGTGCRYQHAQKAENESQTQVQLLIVLCWERQCSMIADIDRGYRHPTRVR